MSRFKLTNFELIATKDPVVTVATFDIEFSDHTAPARRVSMIDNGTHIRLSGIERLPLLREEIIGDAMEQAERLRRKQ